MVTSPLVCSSGGPDPELYPPGRKGPTEKIPSSLSDPCPSERLSLRQEEEGRLFNPSPEESYSYNSVPVREGRRRAGVSHLDYASISERQAVRLAQASGLSWLKACVGRKFRGGEGEEEGIPI